MIIADLIPGVRRKLGNRSDVDAFIPIWAAQVIRNLSQNYRYEELRVLGPTIQFTPGVNLYNVSAFLQPDDEFGMMDYWWMYYSGNSGPGVVFKYRTPPVVSAMANVTNQASSNAIPRYWSRYGNKFIVGSTPAQGYYTYIWYQRKHPFPADQTQLLNAQIYMPSEWQAVIEYGAAIEGAPEVQMVDMVPVWQKLLMGDGKTPGLIKPLVSQFNRDASNNERQINVVVE